MGINALKILKRDAVGRVSYRAEQREAILDEFERSGVKGAAFARLTGLQYQTFASWIQRRRHERGDYQMAAPALKGKRHAGDLSSEDSVSVIGMAYDIYDPGTSDFEDGWPWPGAHPVGPAGSPA
jgi:hypothetical protein